jgi:hypothetical protein
MSRSLGKMSVYKLFNWRDSAANTILETVQAFLELGEAVATPLDSDPQGRHAPSDGSRRQRIRRNLRLR